MPAPAKAIFETFLETVAKQVGLVDDHAVEEWQVLSLRLSEHEHLLCADYEDFVISRHDEVVCVY